MLVLLLGIGGDDLTARRALRCWEDTLLDPRFCKATASVKFDATRAFPLATGVDGGGEPFLGCCDMVL